jgi:hypothetical protein
LECLRTYPAWLRLSTSRYTSRLPPRITVTGYKLSGIAVSIVKRVRTRKQRSEGTAH